MMTRLRRLWRHVFIGPVMVRQAFPDAVLDRLQQVIAEGDVLHRSTVRLIVEAAMPLRKVWRGLSTRQRAVDLFGSFRVWDTEENNGVLLYVNLADRKLELVCDRAAARAVTQVEWQAICATILAAFARGTYEQGVTDGLRVIHRELAEYFPASAAAVAAGSDPSDDRPVVL